MMMKPISVKDAIPHVFESYDFSGRDVLVSNIVNTNKGVGVYKDGCWRTVDWDSSDADRPMKGVTCWSPIEDLEEIL